MTDETPPKLFLSHASKDKAYVEAFMDTVLMQGCGLKPDQILMTSVRETGIPTGENLFEILRLTAASTPLVVAMISPRYIVSSTCLAELGAAWVRNVLFPITIGGVTRSELNGVLQGLLIENPDDEPTLEELHVRIHDEFGTTTTATTWGRHRRNWLANPVRDTLTKPDIFTAEDKDKLERKLEKVRQELDGLTAEFNVISDQNEQLREAKDIDEVKAIVAPKAPSAQFDVLLEAATDALGQVHGGYATSDIFRKHFADRLELPGPGDPLQDEYFAAQDAGMITIDEDDGTVTLDRDFYKLSDALSSIGELIAFFDEQIAANEDFKIWFEDKYKTTPKLTADSTWKKLLR